MPNSFTSNTAPFVAKSVVDALKTPKPSPWKVTTSYLVGNSVTNSGKLFMCSISGQSSPSGTGPTHSSGLAQDGSVTWIGLGSYSVTDGSITSNMYIGFSRNDADPWPNPALPPTPVDNQTENSAIISNMVFALKVDPSDVLTGFIKNEWVTATVYPQYDPSSTSLAGIILRESNVYKCIDNNNGVVSNAPPSGTGTSLIQTADGYVWKYLGSIDNFNLFRFGTTTYAPIPAGLSPTLVEGSVSTFKHLKTSTAPFGDADTLVIQVIGAGAGASAAARALVSAPNMSVTGFYAQSVGSGYGDETYVTAHKTGALGTGALLTATVTTGAVASIAVNAPGANYVNATVLIVGDGTGATATAILSSGTVASVTVDTPGTGYTWAKALVIPGTQGAAAKAVLGPPGGHGSNIEVEIGASALLISKNVTIGNPNIPMDIGLVDGSFRQVSLIGGLVAVTRNAPAVIGPGHVDYATPQVGQVKYDRGGSILYVNNLVAVVHSNAQEEVIKIVLNVNSI